MSSVKSIVTIIDYGVGNLASLHNAFQFLGIPVRVSSNSEEIESADKLLLPGVGAFAPAMQKLEDLHLIDVIQKKGKQGTPLLGICLGMQLFFTTSYENGKHQGLDLIPGDVKKFTAVDKIPHTGWNNIKILDTSNALMQGMASGNYFYFVHSYHCVPNDSQAILASCNYGSQFVASVNQGNVWGVQFHPEKSQKSGLHILANFAAMGENDATNPSD